jgi:hypothetical protein
METQTQVRNTGWTQLYLWFDGDQHGYSRIVAESEEEALAFNGGKPLPTFRGKYRRQHESPTHYIVSVDTQKSIVADNDADAIAYARAKFGENLILVQRQADGEQVWS